MIYGYIRVSTDKQTTDNQRFEILKYADEKKLANENSPGQAPGYQRPKAKNRKQKTSTHF
jgi:DNA invertase Pin-like site-specific DNA recombinase